MHMVIGLRAEERLIPIRVLLREKKNRKREGQRPSPFRFVVVNCADCVDYCVESETTSSFTSGSVGDVTITTVTFCLSFCQLAVWNRLLPWLA